ncbi:MAG: cyanophycin synthetase [Methylophilaceae bacterium]
MEFLKILPLRGPNIWTYRPVLEVWLDIGVLEDSPSNTISGFYERLSTWLPTLIEHRCGVGERGGFLERVREGTWPGHILEHVVLELQTLAGMQGGFGKARSTSVRGIYKVVVRSRSEKVSRAALNTGRDLVMAAIENRPFEVQAAITSLCDLVDRYCLGSSTACIVDAATERQIPSIRLTEGNLVQLGYGAHQHRVWTAETDQTSAIAEGISRDKDLTKQLLRSCGVPVPEGRVVESADDAWEAAKGIGLPIVIKPSDGNHGRGVSTELMTRDEVIAAYQLADDEGSAVMVERFIRGNEHRLLIVGGKLAAAVRGESVSVIGDGVSNIRQLIDQQINIDPRRGEAEAFPLDLISIDQMPSVHFEIKRQGYETDTVLPKGVAIVVQRNGNAGHDVTDEVHTDIIETAALAARIVGLDIAGIDFVAEDISKPLNEQQAAIVEVNAGPGLLMHLKPAEGEPRPVGKAIVDYLFAESDSGRIPVVGVAGTDGKALVAHIIYSLIQLNGQHAGLACAEGLYAGQRQLETGNCATWIAAQKILMNRKIEAAVIENSVTTILSEGLGYDRCQIGVVTNIDPAQHFGKFYIETIEQVYNAMRTQIDVVLGNGVAVLNAADPLVAQMAELCDGEVIFFTRDAEQSVIKTHIEQGGRAVLLSDEKIFLANGGVKTPLINLAAIPALNGNKAHEDIDCFLAAIGAAWALGISLDILITGIKTYVKAH